MPALPSAVAEFLAGKRIVVAGVSRTGRAPANAIFRRLRQCGYEAIPVNPNATQLEGARSYPDLASVPGAVHGVVVAPPPAVAASLGRAAAARGIRRLWFHRAFGAGSVSAEALAACRQHGIEPIVGGCGPGAPVPPLVAASLAPCARLAAPWRPRPASTRTRSARY